VSPCLCGKTKTIALIITTRDALKFPKNYYE
jgi:hypothetical protein